MLLSLLVIFVVIIDINFVVYFNIVVVVVYFSTGVVYFNLLLVLSLLFTSKLVLLFCYCFRLIVVYLFVY